MSIVSALAGVLYSSKGTRLAQERKYSRGWNVCSSCCHLRDVFDNINLHATLQSV